MSDGRTERHHLGLEKDTFYGAAGTMALAGQDSTEIKVINTTFINLERESKTAIDNLRLVVLDATYEKNFLSSVRKSSSWGPSVGFSVNSKRRTYL